MSARNFAASIGAGQTIYLPNGRLFYVRTASSALDIETQGQPGTPSKFSGVGAGTKFGPVEKGNDWSTLAVTSATAQSIEIVISDDGDFEVASTVTVAGSPSVQVLPSAAVASPAAVTFATATASTIAANPARRRITISALDTNAGNLFVQAVGAGAGRGYLLQAGMSAEFSTTAALDVRNDTGSNATYSIFEET